MSLQGPTTSDTRERFIASIAEVVPAARIAEIHFFPPMRQGPIESGVAVVGAEPAESLDEPSTRAHAESDQVGQRASRHVVLMARYRWTRKGPDRGKWETEIIAEADAPLITVEAVARGVHHRAHEESEPERMDGDQVRAILAAAEARQCLTAQ